ERIPNFKLVLIESGFAWLPPLAWRLDKLWTRLKQETPHLKRSPSEYIRESVWLTTQPMEEPQPREHVLDAIDWIGWDRLLFAPHYPHSGLYDTPAGRPTHSTGTMTIPRRCCRCRCLSSSDGTSSSTMR